MLVPVGEYFIETSAIVFAEQSMHGVCFAMSTGDRGFVSKFEDNYPALLRALSTTEEV